MMMNRFQFLLFSFNMRRFTQWINKLRDSKTDCGIPGDAKYRIGSGSSETMDGLVDAYRAAGQGLTLVHF